MLSLERVPTLNLCGFQQSHKLHQIALEIIFGGGHSCKYSLRCGRHLLGIFSVASFCQGVSLTAQRAAIVVGVELPVYDITKKHLIRSGHMADNVYTHFL